jgi:hypothetical protein
LQGKYTSAKGSAEQKDVRSHEPKIFHQHFTSCGVDEVSRSTVACIFFESTRDEFHRGQIQIPPSR